MKATRARKDRIVIALNTLGGFPVDLISQGDGKTLIFDEGTQTYIHVEFPEGGGVNNYPTFADFPAIGESSKLYLDESTSVVYVWNITTEEYEMIGGISEVEWDDILNKPTTLIGYGITDAYNKTEIGDPTTDYVPYFEAKLL